MPANFQFVIPGRRSEAEANPESSNHRPGLLDSGFSTLGLRPISRPGMTKTKVRVRTPGESQETRSRSRANGDRASHAVPDLAVDPRHEGPIAPPRLRRRFRD